MDTAVDQVSRYLVMELNYPAGTGYKCLLHFLQLMHCYRECFQRFNYESPALNLQHYGRTTPPSYNL